MSSASAAASPGSAVLTDDPRVLASFTAPVRAADGRAAQRSTLQLAGLWCAGCARTIEQALEAESGVLEARVSYASQRATVTWDAALTRPSRLIDAVAGAGYAAAPDAAAPARDLRKAEARRMLWRLFVAAFCMMQVMMYQAPLYVAAPGTLSPDLRSLLLWAAWLLSVPVLFFSAAPMFRDAFESLRRRRIGMDVPVVIGIVITFVVSSGATFDPEGVFGSEAYFDSLTMFVTFLLVGRYLVLNLRNRVAATLEGAVARIPAAVHRLEGDGSTTLITPHALRTGDRVRVLAGEAFPADGPIEVGETEADEALLTGESRPVPKRRGAVAFAGSINLRGAVVQRVEAVGAGTRFDGIVDLMRSALADRPQFLRAADRVAGPFLWIVLLLAGIAAAVWSVIDPSRAVWVAVSVLIVTCPCALSLAAPSALLAAAGALSRRGVLVQRLDAIEALARIDTVCLDKTGTLTTAGKDPVCVELQAQARGSRLGEREALALAASLADMSSHPVARALAAAAAAERAVLPDWRQATEQAGAGVEAVTADGRRFRLGTRDWAAGGHAGARGDDGTYLGGPDGLIARFTIAEALHPDALALADRFRRDGTRLVLLSGDAPSRVDAVAARLGISDAQGRLSPADKLEAVGRLHAAGCRVAMVGDGLNDAPVMAKADVSFAVAGGTALTRSKADFTLLSGSLLDIAFAHDTARRTMRIVRQNLAWAIAYNLVCLPLAAFGWFPAWAAGLGMAASSLAVVLNALRIEHRFTPFTLEKQTP